MLHTEEALIESQFLLLEPGNQLLESCCSISELLMRELIWAILVTKRSIQGSFRAVAARTSIPINQVNFITLLLK